MWLEAVVASLDSWWELLTDEKKQQHSETSHIVFYMCDTEENEMLTKSHGQNVDWIIPDLMKTQNQIIMHAVHCFLSFYIFLKQSLFLIWEMRCRALIARYFFLCSFRGALIKVDYSWIWYTWFFSDLHLWKPLKASQLRSAWKPLKAKFCCLSSRVHIQDMENGDLFGIIIVCYLNRTSC